VPQVRIPSIIMSVRDRHRCCECEVILASHYSGCICETCKEEMNSTNQKSWFPRSRMAWLERRAKAAGHVGRGDLMATFGISQAQASSDLQAYLAKNPTALTYSPSRKRYEWNAGANLAITPAPWAAFNEENDPVEQPPGSGAPTNHNPNKLP